MHGLYNGFDIGFTATSHITKPKNLKSAGSNETSVDVAIDKELARDHTSGPFRYSPIVDLHCSPIGGIIKKDGSCRLIMDLSQPKGLSINEGILKEDFTVQYSHFDVATKLVREIGSHCLMSKVDIKHAFRLLPVRPEDWKLLGYFWKNYYFIDNRLPFGLRSSPGIFNRFADLTCWVIQNIFQLMSLVHYADDYFLVSIKHKEVAYKELERLCQAFQEMNIPLAVDKIVGPATKVIYLGIAIDSTHLTISVPEDKYNELMILLPTWLQKRSCTKQQLLSLIGKLSFACKVVRPGRIFLRRLIDLGMSVKKLSHHININKEAQEDIKWWWEFLPAWNRHSLIPESLLITSDDLK